MQAPRTVPQLISRTPAGIHTPLRLKRKQPQTTLIPVRRPASPENFLSLQLFQQNIL